MNSPFSRSGARRVAVLSVLALGAGCSESPVERVAQPVVYGADDRQDVYAHPNADLRALAQGSIVALMRDTKLNLTDPNNVTFTTTDTLQSSQDLCPGQRFENDPAPADCSGTLIANDLVLTAGHCFTTPGTDAGADGPSTCQNTRFVFRFWREAEGRLATITTADVFSCAEVVTNVLRTNADGTRQDYAVVRLDRSAAPRFTPARIARGNAPTRAGQSITVIGFGSGIPAKIDSGGAVVDLRADARDYFNVNTDTFSGNSGSGVFDTTTRDMVGILVRGATDYVRSDAGACNVVNVCAMTPSGSDCGGESVNYLHAMFEDLCGRVPTHSLCAAAGADAGADAGSSPADATAATDAPAVTDTPAATTDTPAATTDAPAAADARTDAAATPPAASGGGCSTSVPSRRGPHAAWIAAAAIAVALRRHRRAAR